MPIKKATGATAPAAPASLGKTMKFCKKCHRGIVVKLENANVKICERDMFHECDVSLEVVKTCLSYGNKKDVANIKRIAGLNLLGMSVTEKK